MKKNINKFAPRDEFYDKDESLDLNELLDKTNDEVQANKYSSAKEISQLGEVFLKEIDNKNRRFENTKQKQIKWILKKCDTYFYEELNSLTYHDVKVIYLNMKNEKKNSIKKILDFILNSQ